MNNYNWQVICQRWFLKQLVRTYTAQPALILLFGCELLFLFLLPPFTSFLFFGDDDDNNQVLIACASLCSRSTKEATTAEVDSWIRLLTCFTAFSSLRSGRSLCLTDSTRPQFVEEDDSEGDEDDFGGPSRNEVGDEEPEDDLEEDGDGIAEADAGGLENPLATRLHGSPDSDISERRLSMRLEFLKSGNKFVQNMFHSDA